MILCAAALEVSTKTGMNERTTTIAPLHPTLQVMRQRQLAGSKPGQRTDGCRVGLVVEGGGMQGIISASMLLQLSRLGLRSTIDAVYGASAGAINGEARQSPSNLLTHPRSL